MIIRIYWGKLVSGAWPAIEERYRELNRLPVPGLLGRLVSQDLNDSECMFTITYWKDFESVRAWENSEDFRKVFRAAVEPYLAGSQTISICEVRVGNPVTPTSGA